jgi:hypothetical protein
MADFLLQEWLSDLHIHTMLAATRRLHHHALSCADSSIEIASPDFPYHVFMSDLLATTPISPNYSDLAPKSVIRLGNTLANATNGLRIAAITFSLPNNWACLFVDSQAKMIHWADSLGCVIPAGYKELLRTWLAIFIPQHLFLPLQYLPCASQTDGYSCGIIAVNTVKHHLFGDDFWTESCREILCI